MIYPPYGGCVGVGVENKCTKTYNNCSILNYPIAREIIIYFEKVISVRGC
jgi:hypothetical protein